MKKPVMRNCAEVFGYGDLEDGLEHQDSNNRLAIVTGKKMQG